MHIEKYLSLDQLDRTTIEDCSHGGACDEDVAYHRKRLALTVNRDNAIRCLKNYGAWDDSELENKDNEDLAEIILWIACGDFRDYLENLKEGYSPEDCPHGSDIFPLE